MTKNCEYCGYELDEEDYLNNWCANCNNSIDLLENFYNEIL